MALLKQFDELVVTSRPGQAAGSSLHEMRENTVRCLGPHGLHRMAYTEWGEAANPRVLLCVHGLTRNGRDFDVLANALASDYRVVCPDVVGRGRSDRLFVSDDYALPVYANDLMTLIARLGVDSVHWLGTSMGGLIGMFLSSLPGSPISRLVLNDVGPVIGVDALQRIGEYLGKSPDFADLDAAEAYVRTVCAPFGALTDAQWRYMTAVGTRARTGGGFEMDYDRAIAKPYQKAFLEKKARNQRFRAFRRQSDKKSAEFCPRECRQAGILNLGSDRSLSFRIRYARLEGHTQQRFLWSATNAN
jgi:pimeloyl-ACP methyl ester carboxylesterase